MEATTANIEILFEAAHTAWLEGRVEDAKRLDAESLALSTELYGD